MLPLGAACLHALYQITRRKVSTADAPLTSPVHTTLIGGLERFQLIETRNQAGSERTGNALVGSTVTPFGYTMPLWATLFGFVLFADLAQAWTVAGALVMVLHGLYILRRRQLRRGAG